jgi:hypothetical protein
MQTPFRALSSASNIYRRKLCPGSETAEDGLPDFYLNNPAAIRGTLLHHKEEDESESRDELKAAEIRALDKNRRMTERFLETVLANYPDHGEAKRLTEHEFFLCDKNLDPVNPPFPGHADEVIWYPRIKVAFVFDSKFGRYPVARAEMNYQLRAYFVMIHDDIGGEKVYAAIRQPYLIHPDDFHSVEYDAADVEEWREELLNILAECKKPDARRIPSCDACGFCKAKGIVERCPESLAFARDIAKRNVVKLNPGRLEQLGDEMRVLTGIAAAWHDRMLMIATQYPELLREYELAPEQFHDSVPDPAAAFHRLEAEFPGGVDEFLNKACKVSPAKISAYWGEKYSLSSKDAVAKTHEMLGRKLETDTDAPDALIIAKPKQRSLKKIKRV